MRKGADSARAKIADWGKRSRMRSLWSTRASSLASARLPALMMLCLAPGVAAPAQTLIVAFGACNVSGKGVWPWEAWPAQLEVMLKAKGYNVHIKNACRAGDTTSGMLHRLFDFNSWTKTRK
jgi:lysophospholipase L1-like esterase